MYRSEFSWWESISIDKYQSKEKIQQEKLDFIFRQIPYLEVKNEKYEQIRKDIGNKVSELLSMWWLDKISIEKFKYLDIRVVSQKILLLISTNDCKYEELLNYLKIMYKEFRYNYQWYDYHESKPDYENRCKSIIDDFIELWIIVIEGDNLSYRFKKQNI